MRAFDAACGNRGERRFHSAGGNEVSCSLSAGEAIPDALLGYAGRADLKEYGYG